jgi:uncharacterized protein (DUF433 family)
MAIITAAATDRTPEDDKSETTARGFYTPAEAARIARVPRPRLAAWRREGIIVPTIVVTDLDGRLEIGYDFEALVYLRLLRMLRERGVPLERAVIHCLKHLRERFGPPGPHWATARIFVQGRDVFVLAEDAWQTVETTRGGQLVAEVLLGEEFARLRERADALLVPHQFQAAVEIRPEVRSGLPVVRGTTLRTAVLHRLSQRGQNPRQIHDAYPHVTSSQIKSAIAFEQFLDDDAA